MSGEEWIEAMQLRASVVMQVCDHEWQYGRVGFPSRPAPWLRVDFPSMPEYRMRELTCKHCGALSFIGGFVVEDE
jgi:hypothetical protein